MPAEKRALIAVFKPDRLKSTAEMRDMFSGSYPRFLEMDTVEFKCWWCDQDTQQWGALYIFVSEAALNEYVASDLWQKEVPQKYGCVPTWNVVEPGPVLAKKEIKTAAGSWISG